MTGERSDQEQGSGVFGRFVIPVVLVFVLVAALQLLIRPGDPPRPESAAVAGQLASPDDVYDPVMAGEALPRGFRQLLPRDAIAPVYEPEFVTAASAGWEDDTLVIGVEIDGDARAYPVRFLNRREMVIDRIAGIPVLVTW